MGKVKEGLVIAGKYRLDKRVGGGGMGSIWHGWDLRLDIPVAIKFMHSDLVDEAPQRARFEREAKAAAQLRCPNVVHMYDHGVTGKTPYLVMELLEGEDLGQRIKRVGQLPVREVARICTEICRGLHRAHRRDIVHRDLKPGNVFLSAPDDDLIKILDFGIARARSVKAVGSEATTTGQLLGSPHYMSPEQARSLALDGRSDLWSLAVILYRGLTAKYPFRGVEVGDLIVRICTDPVPPPSMYRPALSKHLDQFFERAFQREPADRFQTAKEFAAAFDQAARDSPTAADWAPPSDSSWDSTGGSLKLRNRPSGAADASDSFDAIPSQEGSLPSGEVVEPTLTGTSGTLGKAKVKPDRGGRWGLWAAGAAALTVIGGLAAALWVGGTSPSATSNDMPSSTAASAAADATQAPAAPSSDVDAAAPPAPSAAPEATATASASVSDRPLPPPPRPATPRPAAPKPRPDKPSPGYKPSDLGY